MPEPLKLNNPWLVAVWPGMGSVAISAGYYLMAKLGMNLLADFSVRELFDIEHVEIKGGLVQQGRLPRCWLFAWTDPAGKHDIVVFIGEAQPPTGKYTFCHRLIEYARELGVQRVFTFAAMATQMQPAEASRVFGAATDQESLDELKRMEVEILQDGHIGGLNGVLLSAAVEGGLRGSCLLGEIPHVFAQFPFPKASLAVLRVFTMIADIEVDTSELSEQALAMEQKLVELLAQLEQAVDQTSPADEQEPPGFEPPAEDQLSDEDEQRIERLFQQARQDRSTAYELKRELDRLGIFAQYEDRFLDLFKKSE